MARALRLNVVKGWYHVTNRGIDRRTVFVDDRCYGHFVELMQEVVDRSHLLIHAYVLMPNHFHLVVETPEANLSVAMQWLSTSYSMWFNRRENRVGPLFQGRFKAVLFDGRTETWPVSRYVHLNPVRIKGLDLDKGRSEAEALGLVQAPEVLLLKRQQVLREYQWSSYPAYAGWTPEPEWLEANVILSDGRKRGLEKQRAAYRTYVESTLGQTAPDSPLGKAAGGLLLGGPSWVEKMRRLLKGKRVEQKVLRRLEMRPEWSQVRKAVEKVKGEAWDQFAERHGDWGRDLAFYLARRHGGMSLQSLADETGITNYYTVAQAIQRTSLRLKKDKQLQKAAEEVIKCLNIQT